MRSTGRLLVLAVAIGILVTGLAVATFSPEKYVHHLDVVEDDERTSDPIDFENLSPNAKEAFRGAYEASQGGRTDGKYVVTGASNRPPEFDYPTFDTSGGDYIAYTIANESEQYALRTHGDVGFGSGPGSIIVGGTGILLGIGWLVVGVWFAPSRIAVSAYWGVLPVVVGHLLLARLPVGIPVYLDLPATLLAWNAIAFAAWGIAWYVMENTDYGPNAYPLG